MLFVYLLPFLFSRTYAIDIYIIYMCEYVWHFTLYEYVYILNCSLFVNYGFGRDRRHWSCLADECLSVWRGRGYQIVHYFNAYDILHKTWTVQTTICAFECHTKLKYQHSLQNGRGCCASYSIHILTTLSDEAEYNQITRYRLRLRLWRLAKNWICDFFPVHTLFQLFFFHPFFSTLWAWRFFFAIGFNCALGTKLNKWIFQPCACRFQ